MIHWTGNGYKPILVLVAVFATLSSFTPRSSRDYIYILSLIITGFYSWKKGKEWNVEKVETIIKKGNKKIIIKKDNHSLMWIKIQYWGFIFWIFAIIKLIKISMRQALIFVLISVLFFAYKYFNFHKIKKHKPVIKILKKSNELNKEEDISRLKKKHDKQYSVEKKRKY